MVGFLKTFTQNSTTICHTSRRQPDPPGDLFPQLWLCTQLVIALRRWRFTAEDTADPTSALMAFHACLRICGSTDSRLQYCHWRFTAEDTPAPAACANGSPRLSPDLWRCAQYVAVLPLAVHCRGYGRPCICANGSPCLSSRSVALQDSRLSCHHRWFTAEDITGPCSLF